MKAPPDWYDDLRTTYGWQQRKSWYSNVADAYNRVRPRYPQAIITRAVEFAQIPQQATILEIGCGPGIATVEFAQAGFAMLALEPSYEAYQVAQHNCLQYKNVNILNTTFEEWELEPGKFNAVLAATSWHWVSPEIRYSKAATALKDNGSLILLWNTPPQISYEVYQPLHQVYQKHAPTLAKYEDINTHAANLSHFAEDVLKSGKFKNLVSEQIITEVTYSVEDYLALLSTLTPYIKLEPETRHALFAGLEKVLAKCGDLQLSYLSVFHVAQKV